MRFKDHYEGLLIMTKMYETCRMIKKVCIVTEIVPVVSDKTPSTDILSIYGSTALCWALAAFSVSWSFTQSVGLPLDGGSARRKGTNMLVFPKLDHERYSDIRQRLNYSYKLKKHNDNTNIIKYVRKWRKEITNENRNAVVGFEVLTAVLMNGDIKSCCPFNGLL
jgi:hypothetical protein